jgi:hypothetical protein
VRPPKPIFTFGIGSPLSAEVTVPAMRPFGASGSGATLKSSAGDVSLESVTLAKKPMPRFANTCQMASRSASSTTPSAAARIALRMSRKDGSGGDSRMPWVTIRSARSEPPLPSG